MENKACSCSAASTPQVGKSFRIGDVFETHMNNFYKQTSQKEIMKKLTEALMVKLASSVPSGLLNRDLKNRVEESLQKLVPLFHTPTHPDYALMICTAIDELEAKRGSTNEEALSKFIKEEFQDLPLAHDLMLRHYLKRLCGKKEIVCLLGDCYTLAVDTRQKWKRRQAIWKRRSQECNIEAGDHSRSRREQENVTEEWNVIDAIEDQRLQAGRLGKQKQGERGHEQAGQGEVIKDDEKQHQHPSFI